MEPPINQSGLPSREPAIWLALSRSTTFRTFLSTVLLKDASNFGEYVAWKRHITANECEWSGHSKLGILLLTWVRPRRNPSLVCIVLFRLHRKEALDDIPNLDHKLDFVQPLFQWTEHWHRRGCPTDTWVCVPTRQYWAKIRCSYYDIIVSLIKIVCSTIPATDWTTISWWKYSPTNLQAIAHHPHSTCYSDLVESFTKRLFFVCLIIEQDLSEG